MLFLVGLGFLVTLRSINVFVFDWLVKVKLVCDLRSLRRNVITQVLFPAAVIVLVSVH